MRLPFLALLSLALCAGAANNVFPPVFPPKYTEWVSAIGPNSIANGERLKRLCYTMSDQRKLIVVTPGDYYIRTNTQSLLRPGVNMYCYPGVRINVGTTADSADERAMFDDAFDGLGARTNGVYGSGEFIITNQLGRVILMLETATKIHFECKSAWTLGNNPCVAQDVGELFYKAEDFTRSEQYDGIACGSSVAKTYFESARVFAGDSIAETGQYTNWGDGLFIIGYAECLASGGANSINGYTIGSNSWSRVGVMNFKRANASIGGTSTNLNDPGTGVLEGCTIKSLAGATVPTICPASASAGTAFKLKNCTILGPTSFVPILAQPIAGQFTIEDCTVVVGGSATNWVRASNGTPNIRLYGRITTNRTNASSVVVLGHTYTTNANSVVTQ